jgi:Cd2+/Zn2+-exporting ATPase
MILSHTFPYPVPSITFYLAGYAIGGMSTFGKFISNMKRGRLFDENFLMILATTGALTLKEFAEATTVMALYSLGEFLEARALERSKLFVQHLLSGKTQRVQIERDGQWVEVRPQEVKVGDTFRVSPGEKILLDGVVLKGTSHLDTSNLTGESLPLFRKPGDEIWSGTVNLEGNLILQATRDYEHSTINTITQLLENALQKKAPTERFITRFARYYTPVVIIMAGLLLFAPLLTGNFGPASIYRALTVLMISCPCALVISIPLGFLAGIGKSARLGVLVKGSTHLEALTHLGKIFFDKTGTLTQGNFRIKAVKVSDGTSQDHLLKLASAVASYSQHPLARAISSTGKEIPEIQFNHYREIPGAGIIATTSSGAEILLGNEKLLKEHGVPLDSQNIHGSTTVHLARNGKYLGYILLEDTIKDDALQTIVLLKKKGIQTYLLSGDKKEHVAKVAREMGIETFFAELLPQEKVEILKKFLHEKRPQEKIAFVGDGMNDAPALATADLGIAMGKRGIDVAIETADIVLMTDELSTLSRTIEIAHKTMRIIWQNISFSIGTKVLFLGFATLGMVSLWEAVFADVGIMSLAILNSLRLMRRDQL